LCTSFASANFGFEGYLILLPFSKYQIPLLITQNTAIPPITAQSGKNTQIGMESRKGACIKKRMMCKNMDHKFEAEG
jgi:hypothetical protein